VNVDNPTFLAGDNVITVGVERHALRRVPLQAEGTAGRLVVFVEEEERGTEVAFHRELEVGRLDAVVLVSVGECSLPSIGFTGLELDEEGVEARAGMASNSAKTALQISSERED